MKLYLMIECNDLNKVKKTKDNEEFIVNVIRGPYNPIGYTRVTHGSKHSKKATKYSHWKNYVYNLFCKEFCTTPENIFKKDKKYYCFCKSFFVDNRRCDSENVSKGVIDAIFKNSTIGDKNVAGGHDYYMSENPCVEFIVTDEKKLTGKIYDWLVNKDTRINIEAFNTLFNET